MKTTNKRKYLLSLSFLGIATLALVSWSPTSPNIAGTDIIMNTGKVTLSAGALETKQTGTTNGLANSPAVVVGTYNNTDGSGSSPAAVATTGLGLVVGTSNRFGTASGGLNTWKSYGAVIGESNRVSIRSSMIVGYGNTVTPAAQDTAFSYNYSGMFGFGNTANLADSSLVVGYANTMGVSTNSLRTSNSATIGSSNGVFSDTGWAVGHWNIVSATRGVAIGSGTRVVTAESTALGRYNAPTGANDILVVGTGTDDNNRSTALTITSNGGVILGRAQGDISMGAYQ